MERNRLAALLDGPGYASSACRHVLLDGAWFVVWDKSGPADRMVETYERREASAAATGTSTLGFAEALTALRAAGRQQLRLSTVTLAQPAYQFTIFLALGLDAVVACLGIRGIDPPTARSNV